MLRYNSFRAQRYLRSSFVEGKYLLASEASDIELELIDLLRTTVQNTLGDVAIDNAWKVTRLNSTQILITPGEAWFRGLPLNFRSGKDQLVSGASLVLGNVPLGVVVTDDSTGLGKILTFNSGGTTPTGLYRLVVTASEQLITSVQDPFLQNANLTETTSQKIRLVLTLNIVLDSQQNSSPIPYTNDTNQNNLINDVIVTPVSAGNGEVITVTPLSGTSILDGRSLEITVRNDPGLGGGNPIPNGSTDQQVFTNGKLIDSLGTIYHLNAVFNDTVSTQAILRIDAEPNQPNPQLINTMPYTLRKQDVYVGSDVNGMPTGRIFWPFSKLNWDSSLGIVDQSDITDLRNNGLVSKLYEDRNALLTQGGVLTFTGSQLQFTGNLKLELEQLGANVNSPGPLIIDLGSTTRNFSFNGSMLYAIIDRTLGTAIVIEDAASLPSVTNKEVFLIAKRLIDPTDSSIRLYLRNGFVLNAGDILKIGEASGGFSSFNPDDVLTSTTGEVLVSSSTGNILLK